MKKYFLIACCLCFANGLFAQYTYIEPEICIGTNQGVALWTTVGFKQTNVVGSSVAQNFDVRYNGGFTFRYICQKYFGLIAELNYAQRGWSSTSEITGERYNHRLDYLEIPFLAHIYFGKEKFRFFINLGPKVRFLVNDEATAPFSVNPGVEQDKPIENIFDYSVCGGLGVEFRTPKAGNFILEARYDYGLGNIFHNSKADYFSASNNQAITVSVTYLFNVSSHKKQNASNQNSKNNNLLD